MEVSIGAQSSTPASNASSGSESLASIESALTGHNPHVFRVAERQLDTHANYMPTVSFSGKVERTPGDMAGLELTFSEHQAVTGIPFAASYFQLDKTYKAIGPKEQENFKAIDTYLGRRIAAGRFSDSSHAAAELIRELEGKIHLKDYHDPYYKAEKLAGYVSSLDAFNEHNTLRARLTQKEALAKKDTAAAQSQLKTVMSRKVDAVARNVLSQLLKHF